MDDFVVFLYVLCGILDIFTILLSSLLYRKYQHKAFKYLAFLMTGALFSMLVEGFRAYNRISATDLSAIQHIVYLIFEPTGELVTFLMLPTLALAAVGKKLSKKLKMAMILYIILIVATFPLEVMANSPVINLAREIAGHFVFHISAYIIIFSGYKNVPSKALRNGLKSYLILGIIIVPSALLFQTMVSFEIITIVHPEIPFPYISYCILFNLLCIVNTFRYLFIPEIEQTNEIQQSFLRDCDITDREKEIIELLLQGNNNKQIGKKLFISDKTVKNHVYNIYKKTGSKNRVQLTTRATGINTNHKLI